MMSCVGVRASRSAVEAVGEATSPSSCINGHLSPQRFVEQFAVVRPAGRQGALDHHLRSSDVVKRKQKREEFCLECQ
jgi:hypothetical protein